MRTRIIMALSALAVILLVLAGCYDVQVMGVTNLGSLHLADSGGTATPVLSVNQTGAGKVVEFSDGGTPVFGIRDGGGFEGVMKYATPAQQIVCGTSSITGTGTASHGLTTPAYCMATQNSDFAADGGFVTCAISGTTVTLKQWKVNATPTAGSATAQSINWCVIGTP